MLQIPSCVVAFHLVLLIFEFCCFSRAQGSSCPGFRTSVENMGGRGGGGGSSKFDGKDLNHGGAWGA